MNRLLVPIFWILFISNCLAQVGTNSPYSRFGLGDLQESAFPQYIALGGGVTALSDPYSINPYNPATFNSFGPNSFLLSTGGMHKTTNMKSIHENQITNTTNLSHLTVGFPINKGIGVSLGMLPYSNIGYELESIHNDPKANLVYTGDGGISKVYAGAALRLSENLSIGANAAYLFGALNRRKRVVYDDASFFNSRSNSKINLKGYYYEIGVFYSKDLLDDKEFTIGLMSNNDSEIRVKRNKLVETFEYSGIFELVKDTFQNSTEWGYVILPQYINLGVSYREGKKLFMIADYSMQNWADYKLFDESDNLHNSMKVSGGIQYIPEYNSVTRYYKRMQYRLGARYSDTPLQFEDNLLIEKSISIGVGFPIKRSRTQYDLSVTFGERGTTDNNLLKEQFIKFGLSVSYDGLWFIKRKYD